MEIKTKFCKQCETWSKKKDTAEYIDFQSKHICPVNHDGSAAMMEPKGAVAIFNRSAEKRNLLYSGFIGDGDCKTFSSVAASKPYEQFGVEVVKKECVGHVQKRCGTRLRKLRADRRGQKLSDGRGISGRGRLTDKIMNTLQNYYGMAIRGNPGKLAAMKRDVLATLYHVASTDDNPQHHLCPKGEDSWCKYQVLKCTRHHKDYKHHHGLPKAIVKLCEPIYKDLSDESLLRRCLAGHTQNANECLNKMIWDRCPKEINCGANVVKLASAEAVCVFNDGAMTYFNIAERLGIHPTGHMVTALVQRDKERVQVAEYKASKRGKKRRKKLRAIKKGFLDRLEEAEGLVYGAGEF